MGSKTTKRINQITSTIILLAIRVVLIVALIIVVGQGIKIAYDFGHSIFYAQAVEPSPGHDVTVTIHDGDSLETVADMLKNRGLVANKYSIIVQAKFFDYEVNPGEYTFNTSQTSREILMQIHDAESNHKSDMTGDTESGISGL